MCKNIHAAVIDEDVEAEPTKAAALVAAWLVPSEGAAPPEHAPKSEIIQEPEVGVGRDRSRKSKHLMQLQSCGGCPRWCSRGGHAGRAGRAARLAGRTRGPPWLPVRC